MSGGRGWKLNALLLVLGIYLFICSLCGLKESWVIAFAAGGEENLAKGYIDRVVGNPLSALCTGIIATALVQSSSGVVAVAIATVAAGGMTVAQAIPLVMGANIGTTITSMLIALGYSFRKAEFSKAVPVSLIHFVFNTLNVLLFFALEITTHLFSRSAIFFSDFVGSLPMISTLLGGFPDIVDMFTDPIVGPVMEAIHGILGTTLLAGLVTGAVSFVVLLLSLEFMSKSAQSMMTGAASDIVDRAFKTPFRGVMIGSSVTWALQSSSVATALAVPFAASGVVNLRKIYPYVLGCNIGTTIDPGQIISYIKFGLMGLEVGMTHILLNTFGVLFWTITPGVRGIPMSVTFRISDVIVSSRNAAAALMAFTAIVFFIIPILIIYIGG